MRTYTRKRLEIKELDNVMDLCRLCLEKPEESLPIYSDDSQLYSALALRIMFCVGVEMTREEYLPNIICKQCHKEVERFYLFRQKCEKSYLQLKSHLQATKDKKNSNNDTLKMMFTINPDGSLMLRDDTNGSLESKPTLLTLTKVLNDKNNTEVVQIGTQEQNIAVEESLIQDKLDPSNAITATSSSKEDLVPRPKVPPDPDISEFLTSILTELGILTQHPDGVLELGPKNSKTLELETVDGNNYMFELVEEDEAMEYCIEESSENPAEAKNEQVEVVSIKTRKADADALEAQRVRCPQCGKMLATRGVLARHVRNVHARVRPHACDRCGKTFAQKEVMLRHRLVHQEKRPFQCSLCPKSFTQRSSLATHARLHAPPSQRALTLHQCPHCDKMFLYPSGLSRHLRQHSNKQFICEECGRGFSDKSSLRRHERTMKHNQVDTKESIADASDKEKDKNIVTDNTATIPVSSAEDTIPSSSPKKLKAS